MVKFMGDSALMIFPTDAPRGVVDALAQLRRQALLLWQDVGSTCDVHTKAHVGTVAYGPIGPDQRFDIIGRDVNCLFMLRGQGPETLSAALLAEIEAAS